MRYVYDHDLHIHSNISLCSGDDAQTPQRILQYAEQNGLHTVCITDHFWDETVIGDVIEFYTKQNFAHVNAVKPLPQKDGIRFLFGCETEMDKNMQVGISPKTFDKFDFVIVPTTHFHMTDFTIPKEKNTPRQKADFWLLKLNTLLDRDLPFHKMGVAHLACGLIDKDREKFLETLSCLGEADLQKVFAKAAKSGVGIELNMDDCRFADSEADIVLRPFRIARDCGCKFYMGSDAHHPDAFDTAKTVFERAIDYLELTEDCKFTV